MTLLTLAVLRLGQQAQCYVKDIRREPLCRFCSDSLTAKTSKNHSINSHVYIQFLGSSDASNVYINNAPTNSVKVPIRLAGNESRIMSSESNYSEKTSNCKFAEVEELDLTNGG